MKRYFTVISFFFIFLLKSNHSTANVIDGCYKKQVLSVNGKFIQLLINENESKFYHSFDPWQQNTIYSHGVAFISDGLFLKSDTSEQKGKKYSSAAKYSSTDLLLQSYGSSKLLKVTQKDHEEYIYQASRYTPLYLLAHFHKNSNLSVNYINDNHYVSTQTITNTKVSIFINLADSLVSHITLFSYDELYGDITTTYNYSHYANIQGFWFPQKVTIEKINGKLRDEVTVKSATFVDILPEIISKPEDFAWEVEKTDTPSISVEKYTPNIYFLTLKHADTKSIVVEFTDFVFVAEAPLSIANGELILDEVKKLIPSKPIKYFAYGHFHNWYLGGVRPFVHEGCTILSSHQSQEYLRYIVNAPHALNPDDLQKEPKTLQSQIINDSLTISDGLFEMKLYLIGKQSEHTSDYLVFYFPKEKLLFEGDLVWINKEGELKKASKRQEALHKAINGLGIEVDTIVQSWPVEGYGVKNIIPYTDLDKSVTIK